MLLVMTTAHASLVMTANLAWDRVVRIASGPNRAAMSTVLAWPRFWLAESMTKRIRRMRPSAWKRAAASAS